MAPQDAAQQRRRGSEGAAAAAQPESVQPGGLSGRYPSKTVSVKTSQNCAQCCQQRSTLVSSVPLHGADLSPGDTPFGSRTQDCVTDVRPRVAA